jgi:hypothetical protein
MFKYIANTGVHDSTFSMALHHEANMKKKQNMILHNAECDNNEDESNILAILGVVAKN